MEKYMPLNLSNRLSFHLRFYMRNVCNVTARVFINVQRNQLHEI